ncbi:hypothetical protein K3179_10180 [Qipengyuania sp. GH38]|uniref:hypothetical protein n=1 Tax=Qipengyuania intermedia TaxID=2867244 RepID=UPI001C868F03|nr:hypothetical protein [Qipengyuania intermedia]MBX7514908.1 hypothetical protein [Qipengyuania intermedia]
MTLPRFAAAPISSPVFRPSQFGGDADQGLSLWNSEFASDGSNVFDILKEMMRGHDRLSGFVIQIGENANTGVDHIRYSFS